MAVPHYPRRRDFFPHQHGNADGVRHSSLSSSPRCRDARCISSGFVIVDKNSHRVRDKHCHRDRNRDSHSVIHVFWVGVDVIFSYSDTHCVEVSPLGCGGSHRGAHRSALVELGVQDAVALANLDSDVFRGSLGGRRGSA